MLCLMVKDLQLLLSYLEFIRDQCWEQQRLDYKGAIFELFKVFTQKIPPSQPMLLVLDGQGSHITQLMLLSLHGLTTFICSAYRLIPPIFYMQPLVDGIFKSLKSFFSVKGCRQYMAKNPGCVVTEDILASVRSWQCNCSITYTTVYPRYSTNHKQLNTRSCLTRRRSPSTRVL